MFSEIRGNDRKSTHQFNLELEILSKEYNTNHDRFRNTLERLLCLKDGQYNVCYVH